MIKPKFLDTPQKRYLFKRGLLEIIGRLLAWLIGIILLGMFLFAAIHQAQENTVVKVSRDFCYRAGGVLVQEEGANYVCFDADQKVVKRYPKDFVKKVAEQDYQ